MISFTTLEKISSLSKLISEQGKEATAVSNTPLDSLCNNTVISGFVTGDDLVNKIATESDNPTHNGMVDDLVSNVSRAVNSHIDFTKNVVNAAIKDVYKYVEKHLDQYSRESIVDVSIKRVNLPDFLLNKSLREEIEGYARGGVQKYIEPDSTLNLPNLEMSKLENAISTGNGNLDVSIAAWYMSLPSGFLNEVYENFFVNAYEHRRGKVDMLAYLNDNSFGYDRAIAVFLFSRKIYNSGEKGISNVVKQFLEVSSYRVNDFISILEKCIENDDIILSNDKHNKVIRVCSQTYLTWLAKGNTPEVIYGATLVSSMIRNSADLAARREEVLKAWTIHRAALNSSHRNGYHNAYIQVLRDGFYQAMGQATEPELEYHRQNPSAKDTVAKLFEDGLKEITTGDREDHYRTIVKLVCKARFFYTNSFNFLSSVDKLTRDDKMELSDAFHVATIEYISDYVSDMILIR